MLSNHGGRQLDGAPAPLDCVAAARDAVGDRVELIVDGGVRRGADVLKALALGANACSIGRPYLYALAAAGEAGVTALLAKFREEIERDLALLGCADVAAVGPQHVRRLRTGQPLADVANSADGHSRGTR
jgi:L-lactate dehydrogenase (cytochrome)